MQNNVIFIMLICMSCMLIGIVYIVTNNKDSHKKQKESANELKQTLQEIKTKIDIIQEKQNNITLGLTEQSTPEEQTLQEIKTKIDIIQEKQNHGRTFKIEKQEQLSDMVIRFGKANYLESNTAEVNITLDNQKSFDFNLLQKGKLKIYGHVKENVDLSTFLGIETFFDGIVLHSGSKCQVPLELFDNYQNFSGIDTQNNLCILNKLYPADLYVRTHDSTNTEIIMEPRANEFLQSFILVISNKITKLDMTEFQDSSIFIEIEFEHNNEIVTDLQITNIAKMLHMNDISKDNRSIILNKNNKSTNDYNQPFQGNIVNVQFDNSMDDFYVLYSSFIKFHENTIMTTKQILLQSDETYLTPSFAIRGELFFEHGEIIVRSDCTIECEAPQKTLTIKKSDGILEKPLVLYEEYLWGNNELNTKIIIHDVDLILRPEYWTEYLTYNLNDNNVYIVFSETEKVVTLPHFENCKDSELILYYIESPESGNIRNEESIIDSIRGGVRSSPPSDVNIIKNGNIFGNIDEGNLNPEWLDVRSPAAKPW